MGACSIGLELCRIGRNSRCRKTLIQAAFALASLDPTGANCEPLRLVLVRSLQAGEGLLPCVSSGKLREGADGAD
jgi:hypothetical protein